MKGALLSSAQTVAAIAVILKTNAKPLRRKLIPFVYRALQTAVFPLLILYVLWRIARDTRYARDLQQRFGTLPPSFQRTAPGAIWLHAVSVGEVVSSIELIRRLRQQLPGAPVYVSTTTIAGRELADQRMAGLVNGVFYAPIDYCFAVRRVLRTVRPALAIVLETEIWPNLYREIKKSGAALAIVNGRISMRALPRYQRHRWFFEHVLAIPDTILVQSEEDYRHYHLAGACAEKLSIAGNLKYDFDPAATGMPQPVRAYLENKRGEPIWIAASTMPPAAPDDVDEDDAVIAAWQQLTPKPILVLVPRKPERFDTAAGKLAAAGIPFVRRSVMRGGETAPVLLLDTIGELSSLFFAADVVFMGGTLARRGGHNILEPAAFARPVIIGPHMENFAGIATHFREAGAVVEIASAGELLSAVQRMLGNAELRKRLGTRAQACAEAHRGAARRIAAILVEQYENALPRNIPYGPLTPFLHGLSVLWKLGGQLKRRRSLGDVQRLPKPVISVGGISMGGIGKTPFTSLLTQMLADDGLRPAILTRGYGRSSPEKYTISGPGAKLSPGLTGDEAQIYLREGRAITGIGPDRSEAGKRVERHYHPDVYILDDGFQHARLHRDLDVVLIDALDPFAGGGLFPAGRLREPLDALARAQAFVITRVEPARTYAGIREILARYNPRAPVFLAAVEPQLWIDLATSAAVESTGLAAAFCGLGNPASFWTTLDRIGITPKFRLAFGDHHRYTPAELIQLRARAQAADADTLLTTEKDVMNLPADAAGIIAPLRILWVKIAMTVDRPEALRGLLASTLGRTAPISGGDRKT